MTHPVDEAPLILAAHAWTLARDAETAARAARDDAIRQAIDAGMSRYRAAQVVGISEQAIYKLLRRQP